MNGFSQSPVKFDIDMMSPEPLNKGLIREESFEDETP